MANTYIIVATRGWYSDTCVEVLDAYESLEAAQAVVARIGEVAGLWVEAWGASPYCDIGDGCGPEPSHRWLDRQYDDCWADVKAFVVAFHTAHSVNVCFDVSTQAVDPDSYDHWRFEIVTRDLR